MLQSVYGRKFDGHGLLVRDYIQLNYKRDPCVHCSGSLNQASINSSSHDYYVLGPLGQEFNCHWCFGACPGKPFSLMISPHSPLLQMISTPPKIMLASGWETLSPKTLLAPWNLALPRKVNRYVPVIGMYGNLEKLRVGSKVPAKCQGVQGIIIIRGETFNHEP